MPCPDAREMATSSRVFQGHLPDNVVETIVRYSSNDGRKALHLVSRLWRRAVCDSVSSLAPATCNSTRLRNFPRVRHTPADFENFYQNPTLRSFGDLKPMCRLTPWDWVA